ncbi:MAG: FAD-binding protein, partial [Bacteroidia bacterium]|nr:FAD-binding protein [Bacteroidia bacterium]
KGRVSDILTHILIAKTKGPSYFKKVKTTALDFAILNVAISKIDGKYRIAIGSRPSVAALAIKSMDIVNNATELTKKEIEESALASNELLYATTTSASAEYRKTLAKAYVRRGLEEVNK